MKKDFRYIFLLLLSAAALAVCGCSHNKEIQHEVESSYTGNDYAAVYDIPKWVDEFIFDSDISISDNLLDDLTKNDSGSKTHINYVVRVPDRGCFALCFSYEEKNDVYFIASYNEGTSSIEKKITNLPTGILGMGKVLDEPDRFFVYDQDRLYIYDITKDKYESVLEWDDFSISGNAVAAVYGTDGYVAATLARIEGNEIVLFEPMNPIAGKNNYKDNKLTIAAVIVPEHLRKAVNEYNRNSDSGYTVEIINYNKNAMDYSDAKNKLLISVVSNDPPDLINLSGLEANFSDMAEKKYITDISDFVNSSIEIDLSNYFDKALEFYKYDGVLYAIPYSYLIDTFEVNSEDIQNAGWTMHDMVEYYDKYPNASLMYHNSKRAVFTSCFYGYISYFIGENSGKSHFDCDEFRNLLEFTNRFPDESDYHPPSGSTYLENLSEHRVLLLNVPIESIEMIPWIYYEFGGKVNYIGYPTLDGKPLAYIEPSANNASLSICATSDKKAAAWDFMEYYLGTIPYRYNEYDTIWGIPTDERKLQGIIDEYSDENSVYANVTVNGMKRHALTDEELETFYRLRDSATCFPYDKQAIFNIVWEETGAYFAGQKSEDEIIDIIQSRVQLYLDEAQ